MSETSFRAELSGKATLFSDLVRMKLGAFSFCTLAFGNIG
jgi:hypothetical protein